MRSRIAYLKYSKKTLDMIEKRVDVSHSTQEHIMVGQIALITPCRADTIMKSVKPPHVGE